MSALHNRWPSTETGPTRIKICGITTFEQIDEAAAAGADAIGLVQVAGSPREVSPTLAAELCAATPTEVTPITLLVNAAEPAVQDRPCDWVQLHGDEDGAATKQAARRGPVIRAISFENRDAILKWDRCEAVTRLLIDSHHGGSGVAFDHAAFAEFADSLRTPWILAGGLTPETVADAITCLHPWGVDVSSGVESSRGVKDLAKIAAFCEAVRTAY
ncbi:MAG: phosphoribosylanthranilate isomerase [Phycisphaerales bacterium]|nr:phosphoribosylanthranilate isomerase [Phycisphaerales bacterium]